MVQLVARDAMLTPRHQAGAGTISPQPRAPLNGLLRIGPPRGLSIDSTWKNETRLTILRPCPSATHLFGKSGVGALPNTDTGIEF